MKTFILVVCIVIIAFIGGIIGLLIGMDIGGNYFTSFEFNGVRGYEATGQIGFIVGILVFGLIATLCCKWILKTKKNKG